MGQLGWPNCVGMLGWFKCVGMLGWLELAFPTAETCLFKVRPGVLRKTLSNMWGKSNLPIFLSEVRLFILINMDSLIFPLIFLFQFSLRPDEVQLLAEENLSSTTNALFQRRIYLLLNATTE